MSNKQLRLFSRTLHIIGGALITAFIYSPGLQSWAAYELLLQVGVIPMLIFSGIFLWKQGWIIRLFREMGTMQ